MKTTIIALTSIFLFAFSCKNEGSSTVMEQENNKAVEQAIGKTSDEYNGKLDELLTLEIASEVTGYVPNEAKKKYSKILKDPATHSVSYNWDKGRMKKVNNPITNKEMNIPIDDFVEITWVRNTSLDKFKFDYHTPTAEEIKIANQAMDKKMTEMQGEGKATNEQANSAKEMANSMMDGISFTDISNVGDNAKWDNKYKHLKVFYKGLEFEITAEVSDNEAINKQKAIAVAKQIIQQKL
ncbi:conserved hypothetical protein [Flavobacterium sp. 9AF]|uniref:hypothetical protein n=1 Tax=Flavobacterium sp. 9AF TaxID=2653142 RepID=UPI0012F19D34|nr:hypothetical protein [Flavobacterium sp. 9AF]VXB34197.1 conserved hypothetical protein [Flavobacterium sp. 9AF]